MTLSLITRAPASVILAASRLRVVIEAAAALSAEPARVDHLHQKRAGAVLRVAKALLQDAQDGQADIEDDEVGKLQGSNRMVHAEFHHAIDGVRGSDAFVQRKN